MRCLSIPCATVCAALLAGACSSDPQPALLDAGTAADATAAANCLIPGDYSALGSKAGTADTTIANSLAITVDAGPPRDSLLVRLTAGKGVFAGGTLKTGEFSITGADASLATCGLCVSISADIVTGQGPTKFYFATSGKVTLTTVTPTAAPTKSTIIGSATNLVFSEIDASGAPVSSSCGAKIASIDFHP